MICGLLSMTMPRIDAGVVCILRETIVTFELASALARVDLPTLGAPISATKPQRVPPGAAPSARSSLIGCRRRGRLRARSLPRRQPSRRHACYRRGLRQALNPVVPPRPETADHGVVRY